VSLPGKIFSLPGVLFSAWTIALCLLLAGERPALGASSETVLNASLADALNPQMFRRDFQLKMRAWVFPENRYGPVKIVFSVQVDKSEMNDLVGGELAARVIADDHDETMGTWESQISDGDPSPWVRTVRLPAGSYTMVVAAITKNQQRVGNTFYRLKIDASTPRRELEASSLLLATECQQENHGISERQDLFNPLEEESCILAPDVMPIAQKDKPLYILFRLYSDSTVSLKRFPGSWQAWVEVRDATGTTWIRKSVPFTFCSPRGWGVKTTFWPKEFNLKPGVYRVSVSVIGPATENHPYSAVDSFQIQQ